MVLLLKLLTLDREVKLRHVHTVLIVIMCTLFIGLTLRKAISVI